MKNKKKGLLNFIGIAGLSSEPAHALIWLAPLLSFSVIVGIGLDYNVFLLVRVKEYRMSGHYTTPQSVALGFYKTGGNFFDCCFFSPTNQLI